MILFGHMNPRVTNHFRLASGLGSTGPQASVVEFGAFWCCSLGFFGVQEHIAMPLEVAQQLPSPATLLAGFPQNTSLRVLGFGFRFCTLNSLLRVWEVFPFAPCLPFFRGEAWLGQAGLGWASAICRWLRGWGRRLKLTCFFFFGGGGGSR